MLQVYCRAKGAGVPLRIGVDIGGTFTDLVALDEATGVVVNAKALSTPSKLLDGVLRCADQAGVDLADCRLTIHGTTIGINALLEGKGARTGLLTTEGFRDVLEIGRGNFLRMYDVLYRRPVPLVPRGRCREVPGRLTATGEVLVALDEEAVRAAARQLAADGVESVAIVFLFSYRDPSHEQRAAEIVARELPGVAVSASHRITQEWREYERTSTTVVNAYVQPIMDRYLGAFRQGLEGRGFGGQLLVTESNGGAFSLDAARSKPVHTMESGPAAGVTGCARLATVLGAARLISFDMGGTTAKCAIVERGHVQTTDEYQVDGHPIRIPVIDIKEVSAGGGTIAWIDPGGALALGPQSAGADPGPVCYARGGAEPTVTDANLVLGRIDAARFLGGTMPLDLAGATRAIDEKVGAPLGLPRATAAAGTPVGHRAADLRYLGQEHTVTIAIEDLGDWAELRQKFDAAHQRAYGYAAPDVEVQLLNLRLTVVFPLDPPRLPTLERRAGGAPVFETRKIYSTVVEDLLEYRVYQRDHLRAGDTVTGPAAIEESGTTTLIDTGDTLSVEDHGSLIIHVAAVEAMGGVGGSDARSPRR